MKKVQNFKLHTIWRIFISIILCVIVAVYFFTASTHKSIINNSQKNIYNAGTVKLTEDERENIINEYQNSYSPIVAGNISISKYVLIEVDFDINVCRVQLLSPVDDNDNTELNCVYDTAVHTRKKRNDILIDIGSWYESDYNHEYTVYSYTVRVEDSDGNDHWYYFRVDYSNAYV